MNSEDNKMADKMDLDKTSKRKAILKATLIGVVVGVAFMLTAKFVNFALF